MPANTLIKSGVKLSPSAFIIRLTIEVFTCTKPLLFFPSVTFHESINVELNDCFSIPQHCIVPPNPMETVLNL